MESKKRTPSLSHKYGAKFNQIWKNRKQIYLDLLKDQGLVDSKQKYFDASMSNIIQNVKKNYIMDFMKINKTQINHKGLQRRPLHPDDDSSPTYGPNNLSYILKTSHKKRRDVIKLAIQRVKRSKEIITRIKDVARKPKRGKSSFRIGDFMKKKMGLAEVRSHSLPEKIDEAPEIKESQEKISGFRKALYIAIRDKLKIDPKSILSQKKKSSENNVSEVRFFLKKRKNRKTKIDVGKGGSLGFIKRKKSLYRKANKDAQPKRKPRKRNISFKKLKRRQILDFINDNKAMRKAERSSSVLERTLKKVSKTMEASQEDKEKDEPLKDFSSFLLKIKPHYLNNLRRKKKIIHMKAF